MVQLCIVESLKNKRELAESLYIHQGLLQKEIAVKIAVTEKTIGKWKEKYGWEQKKATFIISKEQELKRCYQQINELNNAIESRNEGERYPSSKEADILSKLAATAKNLENEKAGLSETISVCMGFLDYLRSIDIEQAKVFNKHMDNFIKSKLK